MNIKSKKTFAAVDYQVCDPRKCDPDSGICNAVSSCTHKVIQQLDDAFETPGILQNLCMGCWDCIEACPLGAIYIRESG